LKIAKIDEEAEKKAEEREKRLKTGEKKRGGNTKIATLK